MNKKIIYFFYINGRKYLSYIYVQEDIVIMDVRRYPQAEPEELCP
jgi:hypothetical protein